MSHSGFFSSIRFGLTSLALFISTTAQAQVLTSEGVAGDMDAKSRGPALSVSTNIGSNKVTILADAHNPSKEFDKYPTQFDFFVNRQFFTSQYRSPTLPGPVGIEVSSSFAKPPFNYSVVAKILHPNSIYTTVIEGAVYNQTLAGTLDCTVTRSPSGETETIYTAQQVSLTQSGNSAFVANFDAESGDGNSTINVKATVTLASDASNSTASIALVENGDESSTIDGSASVKKTSSEVSSFVITSSDDSTTISCSK